MLYNESLHIKHLRKKPDLKGKNFNYFFCFNQYYYRYILLFKNILIKF